MKPLATIFLLLALSAGAQSAWTGIDFYPGFNYFQVTTLPGELCSFNFPSAPAAAHYPAFLIQTNNFPISLSNCTVTATFHLECSPGAMLRFGGQGSWNFGTLPPSARFYLATVTGYDNEGPATNYWFNSSSVELSTNTGTATINASLAPGTGWSDGQGGSDTNAFANATTNVMEIGMAFGGGWYYDIGCAMATGTTGSASFHLLRFAIFPPNTIAPSPPQNLSAQ
jgi:hypothetical protein